MSGQSSKSRTGLPGLGIGIKRSGKLLREAAPLRGQLFGQLSELLSTGGVGARVPVIQRAVEASQQATAQGLSRTQEELGRSGVGGIFARNTLAQQRQAGAQQASQIPAAMFQQLLGELVPFLSQTQAGALGISQQIAGAQRTQTSTSGGGLLSSCLAPDTEIETPLGPVAVSRLRTGDEVLTRTENGDVLVGRIAETSQVPIDAAHEFAVASGVYISPRHPMGDGVVGHRAMGRIRAGVLGITETRDIRIGEGTGEYLVPGVGWLKSTLDPRHARIARAA